MFNYKWTGTNAACNCLLWEDNKNKKSHNRDGEYGNIQDEFDNIERKEDVLSRLHKYGQENKIYMNGLCSWD